MNLLDMHQLHIRGLSIQEIAKRESIKPSTLGARLWLFRQKNNLKGPGQRNINPKKAPVQKCEIPGEKEWRTKTERTGEILKCPQAYAEGYGINKGEIWRYLF